MSDVPLLNDVAQLWDDEMVRAVAAQHAILLVRVGGEIIAYEDRCAHQGVRLSEGMLENGVITCSAHHWQFDARTGQGLNPRSVCLKRLKLRQQGSAIYLDPAAEGAP